MLRGMWRRIWRGVIWLVDWLGRVELVRTIMDAAWWAKLIAVVSTGGYLGWLAESVPWAFLLPQGVLLFTSTVWVLDRFGRPSTGRAVSAQEEQGLKFSLIYPEPERDDDWVRQRIVVTNVSSALARSCALVVKRISPPPQAFSPARSRCSADTNGRATCRPSGRSASRCPNGFSMKRTWSGGSTSTCGPNRRPGCAGSTPGRPMTLNWL